MNPSSPMQRGKRYRRIITAVILFGVASFLLGMWLDRTLPGLIVYTITSVSGVIATLYLQFGSSTPLYDERERTITRRASDVTVQLFAYVGLMVFIALFLLDATGQRAMTATGETLLYGFCAFYLIWGTIYTALTYRT